MLRDYVVAVRGAGLSELAVAMGQNRENAGITVISKGSREGRLRIRRVCERVLQGQLADLGPP